MAGAIDPRLKALGELAEDASIAGNQVGDLARRAGKGLDQASRGEFKNALETGVSVAKEVGRFKV